MERNVRVDGKREEEERVDGLLERCACVSECTVQQLV